jgi:alanine racemase
MDHSLSSAGRPLRNTWLEVDLDLLAHNIETLRARVGPGVKLAPVIKADAYGHGAVTIAKELSRLNVAYLCVAILNEALELRDHGITMPILVMGYTGNEGLAIAVAKDITLTIFEHEQAVILSNEAQRQNKTANVHIKVDTGMHRLGKEPTEAFADEVLRISTLPRLCLKGIFSHLRLADEEGDRKQHALLKCFINVLKERGLSIDCCHISDSIAAVKYPEFAMDMVRPGAIIYGYVPKYQAGQIDVRPITTFKTTVTRVQRVARGEGIGYDEEFVATDHTIVATLAAGYSDGYPRYLSRKGEVMIRGKRAKVLGILCMDQTMVDVSDIGGVQAGDEAILFGPQPGAPSVEEVSLLAGTNRNNIISGITRRVPRVYLRNGSVVDIVDYLAPPSGGGPS